MVDRKFFERQEHALSDAVSGVDAALLADLYECASAFGTPDPTGQWRVLSRVAEPRLYLSACTVPGVLHMKITRDKYRLPTGTQNVQTIVLSDPMPSGVVWDRTVAAWEVKALIADIDRAMAESGMFDPATGVRTTVVRRGPLPLFPVGEVFQNRDSVFAIQKGADPEKVIRMFDQPDELRTVFGNNGMTLVCHVQGSQWRRARATDIVCKRWGLARPESFNKLSKVRQDRFLAEVAQEMHRKDN